MNKTIVIFANSSKNNGHCVAGKVVTTKKWIRLVSDTMGSELSKQQCLCVNPHGTDPHKNFTVKPLQKIEISLSKPAPLRNQPENHLISDQIWQQRDRIKESEVSCYLDTPDTLWGRENKVNYSHIKNKTINIDQSLYLVRVNDLQIVKLYEKQIAAFVYADVRYELPVTDPNFEKQRQNSNHQQIICVSLAEKYDPSGGNNYSCYKIVAAIL